MDRIWQWAWDRYARRYSWAICAVLFPVALQIYLVLAFAIVAFEESSHYVEAAAVTVVAAVVQVYVYVLPGVGSTRLVEQRAGPATRSIGQGLWTPPTPGLGGWLPERWTGDRMR